MLWHNVAWKLLGVPGVAEPPLPDYVSPISVWDPTVVRSLIEHIADSTGRNSVDAIGGQLHVSEFVVYGVFVDCVLGGVAPRDRDLCQLLRTDPARRGRRGGLRRADSVARARG